MTKNRKMINFIEEYGCFLYNKKAYANKLEALDQALIDKDYDPKIQFWFHDDVFGSIDWKIEPEFSLDELYSMRAKQIRESYDYLILMYSGGSDSNQILHTFMKNNIHIDELRSYWPEKISKSVKPQKDIYSPIGLLYEYHDVIEEIKKFSHKFPRTKINVIDYTHDIETMINDNFIIENEKKYFVNGAIFQQAKQRIEIDYLKNDADKINSKKIAVIYGCDKPKLFIINNKLCYRFSDISRTSSSFYQKEFINYTPKMFFITKDLPLIPIKQSHVFKNYAINNPKILQALKQKPHLIYDSVLMKKLIYPDYDPKIYQKLGKPSGGDIILQQFLGKNNIFEFLDDKNFYFMQKYKNAKKIININDRIYNANLKTLLSKPYLIHDFSSNFH